MCFPSKPIFIPNIEQIEKQLNGNLGIAEKIESDFIKKISDSTNIQKNKDRFNIKTPDGVGLKSLEQTIITSMLETLKPYMEAGLLMVDLLSAAEDVIARVLGLINPCYVPCTTSNKKSKNGSKILQLKGLNLNLDRISKKLKIALEKGDEDVLKEDVVVPKDKDKTRPAEKPNRVYFAYLDENSLPIEPPSSIKDSGYWFGQFDFVLSNADLYIRRSKEIETKFKGTPDYIQSFKSRSFENLDKICNDEYDFKTNYEENNPIRQGNLLFQLFIKYLYNKNQNILNYQIILKENKNLSKNEFLEKAISENTTGNNEIRLGKKTFKELKNLPIDDIKSKYSRLYQIYQTGNGEPYTSNNDLYLIELENLEKNISQLTIPEKEKKRKTLKLLQDNKNLESFITNFDLYNQTLQLKTDAYTKLNEIKTNINIANSVYKTYNSAFGKDFDKVLENKINDINTFNDKILNEDIPISRPSRIEEINLELTEEIDELKIEELKYESNTLQLNYFFDVIKNNILFIDQIIEQSIQNISAIENINTITDSKINNFAYIVYKKFLYTKEINVDTLNKIKLDQQLKYDLKFKESDNYNINGNESYIDKNNSIEISSFKEDVIINDITSSTKFDEVGKLIYKDDFRIINNTIKLKLNSTTISEPITIEGQDLQELNGLPVYPIDSIIQKTNYLIDPMEYELEFIILDGNLLIQGYFKEPNDVKNSSIDKTKLNCGTFQYRLPDCVFTAMPILVSTLLPKLIDLIKLVVETIQTLFSKTGIVDFLINIISVKLAKYFDQFKPSIKNKNFTNPNKLDEVEKINDDNTIKKQNVPNNPFVYGDKYLLAGSTFINLGFIKMAIELTDDVKIKTHYDKDAEKFDPNINPQVENPILRMVGQIVSTPLKFIIDSFSSLIEIIKKFFNPFSLVEAIPDFLSFKQLLDAINPFNLLASVGFGDILCMLGISTEPKPVTPIIPIPKIPNLSELLVNGGGNVYDNVPDIPFSDIIMKCKKTRDYNNTYTRSQLDNGNIDTNNVGNIDNLNNTNNFDDFINNITKENFGYNTSSDKEEFEVNIPPQTVFNADEVIISDVSLDNKYTKEGLIPYKDKVIAGYTIKSTRDIKKSDNIEDLVKKGLSLEEIYNIQRKRYNTDRYVPSNVFKQIRDNNYNPKNVDAEPKTPNKIVLPKFNISDINLNDFNLGIEELLKKPLTMAGSSVIGSLSGIVELFSFLTDLFNQFLQMPFQILGLDFLSDVIPKIPEIPNPFEKALEEILNKFEDLQKYKDKTELNII